MTRQRHTSDISTVINTNTTRHNSSTRSILSHSLLIAHFRFIHVTEEALALASASVSFASHDYAQQQTKSSLSLIHTRHAHN